MVIFREASVFLQLSFVEKFLSPSWDAFFVSGRVLDLLDGVVCLRAEGDGSAVQELREDLCGRVVGLVGVEVVVDRDVEKWSALMLLGLLSDLE